MEAHLFEPFVSLLGGVSVVTLLELARRGVAERLQQAAVVEPVDRLQRGELDAIEVLPGSLLADQLCLEQADDRLGEGVDAPIAVKRLSSESLVALEEVASAPRSHGQETSSGSG